MCTRRCANVDNRYVRVCQHIFYAGVCLAAVLFSETGCSLFDGVAAGNDRSAVNFCDRFGMKVGNHSRSDNSKSR